MSAYGQRVYHDLVGSLPRSAAESPVLECLLPLTFDSDENEEFLVYEETNWSESTLEEYLISSFDTSRPILTIENNSFGIVEEEEEVEDVPQQTTWIERCVVPVKAVMPHCTWEVDHLRHCIAFCADDTRRRDFICLHGVQHDYGRLICYYSIDGMATYRCEGTPPPERCSVVRIGMTTETARRLKWKKTFMWIVTHNLDRIDFPIFDVEWGGYSYSPREFYCQMDPEFDFDNTYTTHSEAGVVSGSYLLDNEFVEDLLETGEKDLLVRYLNLFVTRCDATKKKFWMRNVGGGFLALDQNDIQNGIFAMLKYQVEVTKGQQITLISKPFFPYWNSHEKRRVFVKAGPQGFLPNSGRLDNMLNTLRPKVVDTNAAEAFYLQLNEGEREFLRTVFDRMLYVFTKNEESQEACAQFLDQWIGRVLFRVGEATQVVVVLDSQGGATGKSSLAELMSKILGTHMVHGTKMMTFFKEKFNSEFNVPLIVMDDVEKNDVVNASKSVAMRKQQQDIGSDMKRWVTSSHVWLQEKFGSNSKAERKISNLLITGNDVDIPGVNAHGTERRFLMLRPLNVEEQDIYFSGEGAFICQCRDDGTDCGHSFKSHAEFWRTIVHHAILDDKRQQFFLEFAGMLYIRHKAWYAMEPRSLFEFLPTTGRVLAQQELQSSEVEQWYARRVALGYFCNFRDYAFWEDARIPMALPLNTRPDLYGAEWMEVMPITLLWKIYVRHVPSQARVAEQAFEADLLQSVRDRNPEIAIQKLVCTQWKLQFVNGALGTGKEWVQIEGGECTLFCLRLPKKAKEVKKLKDAEVKRSIHKSTSGRHILIQSTNSVVQESSMNGYELQLSNPGGSYSSQSNSPPLPRRKRIREAYEIRDDEIEDNGDAEPDNGKRIAAESLSLSLSENSEDREFIDNNDANDGFE